MSGERPHPKRCQCRDCADARFHSFVDGLKAFQKENGVRPSNPNQTVAVRSFTVRAHFRRNPYHMNGDPALKERVEAFYKRFETKKSGEQ